MRHKVVESSSSSEEELEEQSLSPTKRRRLRKAGTVGPKATPADAAEGGLSQDRGKEPEDGRAAGLRATPRELRTTRPTTRLAGLPDLSPASLRLANKKRLEGESAARQRCNSSSHEQGRARAAELKIDESEDGTEGSREAGGDVMEDDERSGGGTGDDDDSQRSLKGFIVDDEEDQGQAAELRAEVQQLMGGRRLEPDEKHRLHCCLRLLHLLGTLPPASELQAEEKAALGVEEDLFSLEGETGDFLEWRLADDANVATGLSLRERVRQFPRVSFDECDTWLPGIHCAVCRVDRWG